MALADGSRFHVLTSAAVVLPGPRLDEARSALVLCLGVPQKHRWRDLEAPRFADESKRWRDDAEVWRRLQMVAQRHA